MADLPLDAPVVGIGRSSLLPKPDTKNLTAYGGAEGEAAGQGGSAAGRRSLAEAERATLLPDDETQVGLGLGLGLGLRRELRLGG